MANRDLNNFREVTRVVADETTGALGVGVAAFDVANKVIEHQQEALIVENFSKAQLELNAMQEQYKIDYQGNPREGIDKFRQARNDVFAKYSEGISPLYNGRWKEETRKLGLQSDMMQDGWAIKQTQVNTVSSINSSMKNYLMQANIDGSSFAASGDESQSFANLNASVERLKEFGYKNLGETTTNDMLAKYRGDYIKMFVSGVGDANPHKAVELLGRDDIRAEFDDPEQFVRMKQAMENRAEIADRKAAAAAEIRQARAVGGFMSGGAKSYAELAQDMQEQGVSPDVAETIFQLQGYGRGSKPMKDDERQLFKADVYTAITDMVAGDKASTGDMAALQVQIMRGVAKGAITEKEGLEWTNLLVQPALARKEANLEQYSDTDVFNDDLGFVGVKRLFEDSIEYKPDPTKDLTPLQETLNATRRSKLYDYYFSSLKDVSSTLGVTVDKINDLPESKRRAIYNDAQKQAINMYKSDISPSLALIPENPDAVLKNGELIAIPKTQQGTAPKSSVASPFTVVYKDGMYARKYADGTIERIK